MGADLELDLFSQVGRYAAVTRTAPNEGGRGVARLDLADESESNGAIEIVVEVVVFTGPGISIHFNDSNL